MLFPLDLQLRCLLQNLFCVSESFLVNYQTCCILLCGPNFLVELIKGLLEVTKLGKKNFGKDAEIYVDSWRSLMWNVNLMRDFQLEEESF